MHSTSTLEAAKWDLSHHITARCFAHLRESKRGALGSKAGEGAGKLSAETGGEGLCISPGILLSSWSKAGCTIVEDRCLQ